MAFRGYCFRARPLRLCCPPWNVSPSPASPAPPPNTRGLFQSIILSRSCPRSKAGAGSPLRPRRSAMAPCLPCPPEARPPAGLGPTARGVPPRHLKQSQDNGKAGPRTVCLYVCGGAPRGHRHTQTRMSVTDRGQESVLNKARTITRNKPQSAATTAP